MKRDVKWEEWKMTYPSENLKLFRDQHEKYLVLYIDKYNTPTLETKYPHKISSQTHILFIMLRPKGIGSCHKSGTWNNQGRQQTNSRENRCFNRNDCH